MTTAVAERSWCVVVPHHARGARPARHRLAAELAGRRAAGRCSPTWSPSLAELVGNAIRHADPLPGGVIRVAWRLRSAPGADVVEVRVTDGGAGTGARLPARRPRRGRRARAAHRRGARRPAGASSATVSARASGPSSAGAARTRWRDTPAPGGPRRPRVA